jgi:membrane-bound ClpP family serine protease|tara:strand:- start:3216 stop:3416 length:201 start_codon:yes stop_codon:yes gene_type:complete
MSMSVLSITILNMNKIVEVLTTPLVTFPLILIGMNAIIYQIAGKKIGKIWGATTAIWIISAAIYVW